MAASRFRSLSEENIVCKDCITDCLRQQFDFFTLMSVKFLYIIFLQNLERK